MIRPIIIALSYALALLAATISVAQSSDKKTPPFKPADYPKTEFQVTRASHALRDIKIRIVHVKRRKESPTPPSFCRAWVEITRGGTLVRRIYYGDLEPVGYSFGVFVPAKQPSPEYFVLVKEGDYDGHLLLANSAGDVTDTLGGSYFVARGRFLVSRYASDEAGLAIFDLEAHKLILRATDIPYVENWYKDNTGYFFTESEWSGTSGVAHEKAGVAYRLNLSQGKIVKTDISPSKLKSATAVKYDFDPRQYQDCVSK
jgi:hypothetical protein